MPQLRDDVKGAEDSRIPTMGPTVTESKTETKTHDDSKSERRTRGAMGGVEPSSSRPPSPPESRSSTPRLSIQPCPARLTPLVPPVNYGAVEKQTIYRSGFPQDRNVEFLEGLNLEGIVTLVEEDMKPEVAKFIDMYGVNHVSIPINANKDGEIRASIDNICEAILFLLNPHNHPVYVHCNRGKHRTGCVIGCLRKCQLWPIDEILAEYETYAGDKARPEDKQLIRSFDPACVYKYAQQERMLDTWPDWRKDSVLDCPADVFDLASSLPAHNTALISVETDDEMSDDDGIMIAKRVLGANRLAPAGEDNSKLADIDMLDEKMSDADEDDVRLEENGAPELDNGKSNEEERVAQHDQSSDRSPCQTSDNVYGSSNGRTLAISPVRARAAA